MADITSVMLWKLK